MASVVLQKSQHCHQSGLVNTVVVVSCGQTLVLRRGVIAFSISALRERGSGRVHSAYSVFALTNVLIFRHFRAPFTTQIIDNL